MDAGRGSTRRLLSAAVAAATMALAGSALAQPLAQPQGRALPPSGGRFIPAETEAANVAVVRDFLAAFEREDLGRMSALLADDVSFRTSQRRPPDVGKAKVLETIKTLCEAWDFKLKIVRIAALGPLVLTEREDILSAPGGRSSRLKIAGSMFFVEGGRIVEWTDYQVR